MEPAARRAAAERPFLQVRSAEPRRDAQPQGARLRDARRAGISSLQADERLVGTGGTVRNLAKVDRRLRGEYPISRLHGYVLDRRRLDDAGSLLAGEPPAIARRVPGLNGDRADSIVGGALVVQAVMDRLLASELTVAGYGLREGDRAALA